MAYTDASFQGSWANSVLVEFNRAKKGLPSMFGGRRGFPGLYDESFYTELAEEFHDGYSFDEEDYYWLAVYWPTLSALGATEYVLGAGEFGVAFRTRNGGVLKLTESADEADAVQLIEDLRRDLACAGGNCTACFPGFPFNEGVWQIPTRERHELFRPFRFNFVIVREDVEPLTVKARDDWTKCLSFPGCPDPGLDVEDARALDRAKIKRSDAPYALYRKAARGLIWTQAPIYVALTAPEEIDYERDVLNAYMDFALQGISDYAPAIGESFETLWEDYGIWVDDMHSRNVGYGESNLCRAPDDFVFFDYMIEDFRVFNPSVAQLNLRTNPSRKQVPKRTPIPLLPVI